MKYILALFAAIMLFSACSDDFFSQTVKIDPPEYEKNLAFHLRLSTRDSVIRVQITRNYGILETVNNEEDWLVSGAVAEIYENGEKWLTLNPVSPDSSFVLTGVLPGEFKVGSSYEIRVEHPDYPMASGIQLVPGDFQAGSPKITYNALSGGFGDRYNLVELLIDDKPGEKNYYEVLLSRLYFDVEYNFNTMQFDTIGVKARSVYPDGFSDPNVLDGFDGSGLISDQFFDGQQYKFQARIYDSYSNDSTITIQVRHVSEDYFKWSRSYAAYQDANDNPLSEPVAIYNNLQDGLGVFSICNEKVFFVK